MIHCVSHCIDAGPITFNSIDAFAGITYSKINVDWRSYMSSASQAARAATG